MGQLPTKQNSLLAPLGKEERRILNTETLIVNQVKSQIIPDSYQIIPFDVKNLFTNVPLNETIGNILRKVYHETSNRNEDTNVHTKRITLGPLLANIFIISLEDNALPKLRSCLCDWKRYINDIFVYNLPSKTDLITRELNSYHSNIKFSYELASNNKLAFSDLCVTRTSNNEVETTV